MHWTSYSGIILGIIGMESYGNNSGIIVACVAIIIFMHVRVHDELAIL